MSSTNQQPRGRTLVLADEGQRDRYLAWLDRTARLVKPKSPMANVITAWTSRAEDTGEPSFYGDARARY